MNLRIVSRPPVDSESEEELTSDLWGTPQDLYDRLNESFGPFTLDGAATAANAKCPMYLTAEMDAPTLHIGTHRMFLNPPYSRGAHPEGNKGRFMRWARDEVLRSAPIACCLVPANTSEGWWQRYVQLRDRPEPRMTFEVKQNGMAFMWRQWPDLDVGTHFIPGRARHVHASGKTGSARYSSAVVVYRRVA